MRALVVEDELNVRLGFIKLLNAFCPEIKVVGETESVESSLKTIESTDFDLLFLDINLPDGSGFDVLHRSVKKDFHVIFVTAYDQYAIDAFKMCAIDYLLKPVSPDRLRQAIAKLPKSETASANSQSLEVLQSKIKGEQNSSPKIILKDAESLHIVLIPDIIYCNAEGSYTSFILYDGRKITTSLHLKEYERLLQDYNFIRCHHSHLINLFHVKELRKAEGGSLIMTNNDSLPLSSRKRSHVLEALKERFLS